MLAMQKRIVDVDKLEALDVVSKIHQDPQGYSEYEKMELDESMDLSIIVPVYNYVELIEDNIMSILNQKTQYEFQVHFPHGY